MIRWPVAQGCRHSVDRPGACFRSRKGTDIHQPFLIRRLSCRAGRQSRLPPPWPATLVGKAACSRGQNLRQPAPRNPQLRRVLIPILVAGSCGQISSLGKPAITGTLQAKPSSSKYLPDPWHVRFTNSTEMRNRTRGYSRGYLETSFLHNSLEISKIGLAGFEPTTPCPPGRCATRLRYSPLCERGARKAA
ncbi:MAG: hypothetical protein RLZZ522_375 [Verrucomicrobiota bacterium]